MEEKDSSKRKLRRDESYAVEEKEKRRGLRVKIGAGGCESGFTEFITLS